MGVFASYGDTHIANDLIKEYRNKHCAFATHKLHKTRKMRNKARESHKEPMVFRNFVDRKKTYDITTKIL